MEENEEKEEEVAEGEERNGGGGELHGTLYFILLLFLVGLPSFMIWPFHVSYISLASILYL